MVILCQRVKRFLESDVSSKNYHDNLEILNKKKLVESKPYYDKARKIDSIYKRAEELGKPITKEITELLNDDRIKKAIKSGKAEYGVSPKVNNASLEALDGAKKALDDIIGSSIREGKNAKASQYLKLKKELVGVLDVISPDYKKARQIYSGEQSLINAQEEGVNLFKRNLGREDLKVIINNYNPSEQEAYKIGVKKAVLGMAGETLEGANPIRKILAKPNVRGKLLQVLGTKDYKSFINKLKLEDKFFDARNKFLKGSQTAERFQEDLNLPIAFSKTGFLTKGVDLIAKKIYSKMNGITEKNAEKLADFLTDQNKLLLACSAEDSL